MRERVVRITQDTTVLDSLSIAPGSSQLLLGGQPADTARYRIDPVRGTLYWPKPYPTDSVVITYRVLPFAFHQTAQNKDIDRLRPDQEGNTNPFTWSASKGIDDPFATSGLNKSGSISRGIAFGNNQDLSVNSNLQLELSGHLNDRIQILASVTDDNIPIQPEGNTQQLQDFDQVFIKIFDDRSELVAGDFRMQSDKDNYYLRFFKKAQGALGATTFGVGPPINASLPESHRYQLSVGASVAASRGKFARNVIQGVEGNQGPYRLSGDEGETFIIILSGTERVYIDGELLNRGQEFDYVINYNTSEIIFTPNRLITKDKRITVEFQYSDKNYARFINEAHAQLEGGRLKLNFTAYNEFDSRNQPLQQTLDDVDRTLLSNIGDNLDQALVPSIDTVSFSNEFVLYALVDSLGYDSVFLYSTSADSARYQIGFTQVGQGNGDYILADFTANGRVFQWIGPDTVGGQIIRQGEYAPIRRLITPKKRQMVSLGAQYKIGPRTKTGVEIALSNNDLNTFSSRDRSDNLGTAVRFWGENKSPLQDDPLGWHLDTRLEGEYVQQTFQRIERFRPVEFERNWNLQNLSTEGDQLIAGAQAGISKKKSGFLRYTADAYQRGEDYTGLRNRLMADLRLKGFSVLADGSYLVSEGVSRSRFLRHKSDWKKRLGPIQLGFKDEHEFNQFFDTVVTDSLRPNSYRFYDWQTSIGSPDSSKNRYSIFYRQRTDWGLSTQDLKPSTFAAWYGFNFELVKNRKSTLRGKLAYRQLEILDTLLTAQAPDNTLVSRLEYNLRAFKEAVRSTTFYEIGTGLEQRREFVYVQVPAGQGVYAWIDYNGNDVKELNEFEIAAFPDQAEYIRVFTPSNVYVKTFTNQFNQVLNLQPSRVWKKASGVRKYLAKLTTQTAFRIDRKTNNEEGLSAYNPFLTAIADTALLSLNSSWRNTVWLNRNHQKWGLTHIFQDLSGKTLLNGGFDSRANRYNELRLRLNLNKKLTLTSDGQKGTRSSASNFLSGRTYTIDYLETSLSLAFQPNTGLRLSVSGSYEEKQNRPDFGGETALIRNLGTELRYNVMKKGSMLFNFNAISISYDGLNSTALAFEMLDALQPGINFTWSSSWQRKLSKNLQLTLNYNGRKSEESNTVHTGGMSVRAFF